MSEQHSPTPWTWMAHSWQEAAIYCGLGPRIALLRIDDDCNEETQDEEEALIQANARRIVASVNELADLTTQQIEDGAFKKMRTDRDLLEQRNVELQQQRDELLAALKAALESTLDGDGLTHEQVSAFKRAITKAEQTNV